MKLQPFKKKNKFLKISWQRYRVVNIRLVSNKVNHKILIINHYYPLTTFKVPSLINYKAVMKFMRKFHKLQQRESKVSAQQRRIAAIPIIFGARKRT